MRTRPACVAPPFPFRRTDAHPDARITDRLDRRDTDAGRRWRADYVQRLFRHAPADHDPVILRHSRIYILPTRRGVAFLATLAMTLLTSLNYSLSLGFVATFALFGLVAVSLVHTFRNLAGIELRPLAAGETFAGGVMPFTLVLAGGATPRYAITLSARGCTPVTVDVVPDAALPVALELLTPRRGRIVLGRVTLSSGFPAGLWHGWAYVHFPLAGIAFPTPEFAPPPLPAGNAGQDDHTVTRGDNADLAGLRDLPAGRPDAARRVEGRRARRRLAHEAIRGRRRRRSGLPRLGRAPRDARARRCASHGSPRGCSPPSARRVRSR